LGYGGAKSTVRTKPRRPAHAFVFRAGIGLGGTHVTCDATGFASDLVFLSHAQALGTGGAAKLAGERGGRRQILATDQTLRLLGEAGEKLRPRALPAAFGRPFNLGGLRIEIVPTGFLPGSAGLLCETEHRRTFYLGAFAPEPLLPGLAPADMREADAICIDASVGHPGLSLPSRKRVLEDLHAFVKEAVARGETPVVLASAVGTVAAVAAALAQASIPMRTHARFATDLARLHDVCGAVPLVARTGRKLPAGEALLWPSDASQAAGLRAITGKRLALVSPAAADADTVARMGVDAAFPLTSLPGHAEILSAIKASGAREVALFNAGAEELAEELRGRGFDAYTMGPPRQMTLVA
jgi:hypothetical protein